MSQFPNLSRVSAPPASRPPRTTETPPQSQTDKQTAAPQLTRNSVAAFLEKRSSPNLERSSLARAEQELQNRAYYPTSCNVTLSIRDNESGDFVHYKFDGTRFKHADATIKMTSGASYDFHLKIKPKMDLTNNLLHLQCSHPDTVPRQYLVSLTQGRGDTTELSGSWKCELEPNKKSDRVLLDLSGRITHFGDFHVPFLLKIYPESAKAAVQGFGMRMVTFELKQNAEVESDTSSVKLNALRYISQ